MSVIGTACSRPFFITLPGTVIRKAARSIQSQRMAASSPRRRPVIRPIFTRPPNGPPDTPRGPPDGEDLGLVQGLPVFLRFDHVVLGCGGHAVPGQWIDGNYPERKLAVQERAQVLSEVTRSTNFAAALDPLDRLDQGHAVEIRKVALHEMA